jgi:hypothetical protein
MNTISIIVSVLVPLVVIGYIIWDLQEKYPVKVPKMSYDAEIDDTNHDCGENNGDRLSQSEILENTAYMLDNYADLLK